MSKHFLPDAILLASRLLESAYKYKGRQLLNNEALLVQIPTSHMAQKVATARKMKTRQETTSLPWPNCVSDGKAHNKRQVFINTDTRRFKIQTGDMGPPFLTGPQYPATFML